jgi:hypothetical protein
MGIQSLDRIPAEYHGAGIQESLEGRAVRRTTGTDHEFTYTFENFFHPFVAELLEELSRSSLKGMLDPGFLQGLSEKLSQALARRLGPPPADNTLFYLYNGSYERPKGLLAPDAQVEHLVKLEGFLKKIELDYQKPYAVYNWELLFHIPLTIAVHLGKNQRFAEAQRWFHYIFDPTCNDTSILKPQRFWKFLAFREPDRSLQGRLVSILNDPDAPREDRDAIFAGYRRIKDDPFQPHAVARTRPLAYQYCVVMKYLDNLIAWGDSLFRQDTLESINEATQRYILAANLLGERPQQTPRAGGSRPMTFAQLRNRQLDELGNALVEMEAKFPFNLAMSSTESTNPDTDGMLFGIGRTLYFCIPRNEKLLGYWDTVEDRLFKIRHCMNIEGVVRQLALFDPPLDPGLLVKARAAGIDVGSIVSGLNQPIGPTRCLFLIQKALELCGEVRSLGAALLSAIEKADSERMAVLRQSHEIKIQQLAAEVRFLQWKQAQESTEALLRSRASALERYRYSQRLLGGSADDNAVPDTLAIDRQELTEENFDAVHAALVAQYETPVPLHSFPDLKLAGSGSAQVQSGAAGAGNLYLNANEAIELNTHLPRARDTRLAASLASAIGSILTFVPEFNVNASFWGVGVSSTVFGGSKLSNAIKIGVDILQMRSAWEQDQAGIASRTASYERRAEEMLLRSNLEARELVQIGRQLIGSLIAEQTARREYLNVKKQIEQSQEMDRFLREKFSNAELYGWMQGELSRLYYEYYRFAFDTARKAELTMKRELMRPELDAVDYVKYNYWDAGRKGLLCGEALYLDCKRMELAYHEHNKREYEVTKHVSLRQLDPLALLTLKATGSCQLSLPEWLFDLDCPGHYLRRIRNVAVSIPAVTGPYTSVNCTLALLESSIRKSPLLQDNRYSRQGKQDPRFLDVVGSTESIVTSSGANDAGLFETNLRDERFLPFEGAGAISTWKLELPSDLRSFDYDTISDVVLHLRYTARQAEPLKAPAKQATKELLAETGGPVLTLLLSLQHDFPTEWHRFEAKGGEFVAEVTRAHFPYLAQARQIAVSSIELKAVGDDSLKTPQDLELREWKDELDGRGRLQISLGPALSTERVVPAPATRDPLFILIQYTIGAAI